VKKQSQICLNRLPIWPILKKSKPVTVKYSGFLSAGSLYHQRGYFLIASFTLSAAAFSFEAALSITADTAALALSATAVTEEAAESILFTELSVAEAAVPASLLQETNAATAKMVSNFFIVF
jgi:hypothetical protein